MQKSRICNSATRGNAKRSKASFQIANGGKNFKEGTVCASELAGIEPTPPAPESAIYARLDHSARGGIRNIKISLDWS